MLSRVADALYWMSRYVERAEHGARLLEVTRGILIDLAELDAEDAEGQWRDTLGAIGVEGLELDRAVFSEDEPGSILSSLSRARENARQVREVISSEMWEHLNEAYWSLKEAASRRNRAQGLSQTLEGVVTSSFLWAGVTDATMRRGEGWRWIKMGQFVERADRTGRLISVRSKSLRPEPGKRLSSRENVLWLMLLRSCSALEAFRKVHPTRLEPHQVLEFLIFDSEFPRTVRYSVSAAARYAEQLPKGERANKVQRAFGRLAANVDYADHEDLLATSPAEYLEQVLAELGEASVSLQNTYFLH